MGAGALRRRRRSDFHASDTKKLKVVLLGANGVGKSTLFRHYVGVPLPSEYEPSTSVNIGAKLVQLEACLPVVIELWDVPHSLFSGPDILQRYLAGADALVLVYSLLDPDSWRALPAYVDAAKNLGVSSSVIVVVATKHDCELKGEDQHVREQAKAWAEQQLLPHVTVCSSSELLGVFKLVLSKYNN